VQEIQELQELIYGKQPQQIPSQQASSLQLDSNSLQKLNELLTLQRLLDHIGRLQSEQEEEVRQLEQRVQRGGMEAL
jgi:hypothetical protein